MRRRSASRRKKMASGDDRDASASPDAVAAPSRAPRRMGRPSALGVLKLCMLSAFVVLQRVQDVWHLLHDKAPSLLDILVGEHGIAVEP